MAGRRFKTRGPHTQALVSGDPKTAWDRETEILQAEAGVLTPGRTYLADPPKDVCRCCGHNVYWRRPDGSEYVCCWCVPYNPLLPTPEIITVPPKEYPCLAKWLLASETELLASSESLAEA